MLERNSQCKRSFRHCLFRKEWWQVWVFCWRQSRNHPSEVVWDRQRPWQDKDCCGRVQSCQDQSSCHQMTGLDSQLWRKWLLSSGLLEPFQDEQPSSAKRTELETKTLKRMTEPSSETWQMRRMDVGRAQENFAAASKRLVHCSFEPQQRQLTPLCRNCCSSRVLLKRKD